MLRPFAVITFALTAALAFLLGASTTRPVEDAHPEQPAAADEATVAAELPSSRTVPEVALLPISVVTSSLSPSRRISIPAAAASLRREEPTQSAGKKS